MKKVAIILSGCGSLDGSEIFESTFTLLEIIKNKAEYKIFASNRNQNKVVNHVTKMQESAERCILAEAARIARGQICLLSDLKVEDFSSLIIPGGFGIIANYSTIDPQTGLGKPMKELEDIVTGFHSSLKPIGALCIAPLILGYILKGYNINITLGSKKSLFNNPGFIEQACNANETVIDIKNKIVTSPAFMEEAALDIIHQGISKLVKEVIEIS